MIDLSDYWEKTPLEQARIRAKVVEKQTCFSCHRRAVAMILIGRKYEHVCEEHNKQRKSR